METGGEKIKFKKGSFNFLSKFVITIMSFSLGSEMGDPGPFLGYLGKGTLPRSPLLSCRGTAG